MSLIHTFRWFGKKDPVSLVDIRQAGATGIVTALHDLSTGEVWQPEAIKQVKQFIEKEGLFWSVVESLNVHEDIKRGLPSRDTFIENYQISLKNLADQGINTVCYNFMPALDWTRTQLDFPVKDGARALRFDRVQMAAFDLFLLKRTGAENSYRPDTVQKAKIWAQENPKELEALGSTIMAGVPGSLEVYSLAEFDNLIKAYGTITADQLKSHLAYFLQAVIPYAQQLGIKMCIHPDDPPFPVLGLPRIVSSEEDLDFVLQAAPSPANGITLCTGSLGARQSNDLPQMIRKFGDRIHFFHLRNVLREESYEDNQPGGKMEVTFHEASHLSGSTDMARVMRAILEVLAGRGNADVPMRPDHGHRLRADPYPDLFPGYSLLGRLKGLAELRGLELGVSTYL